MSVPYIYRRRRWRLLFGTVDALGGLFRRPESGAPDLSRARSILVVKPDQVGDLILTFPLLHALRRKAPEARIEIAVGRGRAPVLSGCDAVDDVHELPIRMRQGEGRNDIDYGELRRRVRRLRARRFDAVVAAKEEPWTVLLSFLTGAPVRVGFREGGLGFLLTHCVPIPERGRHQWEILTSLAGAGPGEDGPPRFAVTERDLAEAARIVDGLGGNPRLPLVVIHPGAGTEERTWPFALFADTAARLAASVPARLVFVAGPEEASRRLPLPEPPAPSTAVALPDPLSLPVFAALLSRADLLIGNDSAPGHLAAAVATPAAVRALSDNDMVRWGPAGPGHEVLPGPRAGGPGPEDLARAAARILERAAMAGKETR